MTYCERAQRVRPRLLVVRIFVLLAAFVAMNHLLPAQSPAAYRTTGVKHYQSLNPHHLYLVLDGDTTGSPLRALSVEREEWTATDSGFHVIVDDHPLSLSGSITRDTLDVAANGRVRSINGMSEYLRGRHDFVPRFPTPPRSLRTGDSWADTVRTEMQGPAGEYTFIVTRRYTVTRQLDSLDRRMAEIEAQGIVRYRDAFWVDSTAGASVWMDVSGPLDERILFDSERGELVLQAWSMTLKGRGGRNESADTVPAGLISAQERVLIASERAELLLRPLPVGDTSVTVRLGAEVGNIFLHTVRRQGDTISSGLLRADGTKGTTHAAYRDGRPTRFRALWTDTSITPRSITIDRRGDSLAIEDGNGSVTGITTSHWAIADYGMPEHLVPLFMSLPLNDTTIVAVYRPVPAKWDTLTVVTSRAPAGLVVLAQDGQDPAAQTMYIIVDDGDLLFAQSTKGNGSQLVPQPGSPRRERLEKVFSQLRRR